MQEEEEMGKMDEASSIFFLLSVKKQFPLKSHLPPTSHLPLKVFFFFLLLMLLFFPFAYASLARAVSDNHSYPLVKWGSKYLVSTGIQEETGEGKCTK